ncbi:arginine biosynthesis bifunctional protein ArgJ [Alkaliphilus metalliredigens QYMF]|uniref:Arginine biosynthesis bifunctional protein ArgJ n=1 Tax=Alkaliphilus metalliredigens (strain QYMF) TaxID=293826 RepID=A6TTJ2_ALKMQ|nr:bifunctional glutamate N-acetyltransferase/amino-acid acetyltransferase ArgJ [Alkaliphilus metalliredigens]ABR49510.1 arginine biosynthesis bifunctional protein ArgJ [Alkaliphilus metalliredigens QYMF]
MKNFDIYEGNVTSPKGFQASGVHVGIKKKRKDIALIVSDVLAEAAAVFTTNKACAAPVKVSQENIKDGKIQGFVINSGNANACTGDQGMKDASQMVDTTAEALGIAKENIIVASTGIIGVVMPMNLIVKGIKMAATALNYDGGLDAGEGIMTTDTTVKQLAVSLKIDDQIITIGGIAKGSGMIHPNMATMLSFVTTDAKVEGAFLQKLLKEVVDDTYNMITVDGDTSTNDMVAVMANGLAENNEINENHPEVEKFIEAFKYLNEYLAKSIVADGEGATKFIEVEVVNSQTKDDAKLAVKSVLSSSLVKTAFFGEDGNWGRIVCSVGYSGANLEMEKVDVFLSSPEIQYQIVENGQGTNVEGELLAKFLKRKEVKVLIDLKIGTEKAKGWGCDLSYEYVKINGAYRT